MAADIRLTVGTHEDGSDVYLRLSKAPHILVAGMTGAGKSVFIHSLLCQLIGYKDHEVGLILVDPKRVEFSRYNGLPHLVDKPVYELGRIKIFLEWVVNEMHIRFAEMEKWDHNDITDHNEWQVVAAVPPWSRLVVVIDELANLILADKDIEKPIVALASMGRAAGIHLILATQRPSADVVTGLIRANVPTRFCLPVVTKMDSRIILDLPGGETLTEPGDMLARLPGSRTLIRMKSAYLEDDEIVRQINIAKILGGEKD